jgi:hypothetical protein
MAFETWAQPQPFFWNQWLLLQRRLSLGEPALGPRVPIWRALFVFASFVAAILAYQRWRTRVPRITKLVDGDTVALKPETRAARGEHYLVAKAHQDQAMHGFSRVLDQVKLNSASLEPHPPLKQPLAGQSVYKVTKETDLARFGVVPQTKVVTMMPAGDDSAALVLSMFGRYIVYPLNYNMTQEEVTVAMESLMSKTILTTSEKVASLGTMPDGILLVVVKPSAESVGQFELSLPRNATEDSNATTLEAS